MILAVGSSVQYEIDAYRKVAECLERKGHKVVLFKQDKCLDGELFEFETKGSSSVSSVIIDSAYYALDEFSAVWYIKPQLPEELLRYEPAEHGLFIRRQFREMRMFLWSLLRDKIWIDDPWQIQIAENKPYQLKLTIDVGLRVPRTLITSEPRTVRKFYEECNSRMIVKILSPSPMLDYVIYTNRVTDEDMQHIDSTRQSPSIFQEYIDKDYELRVTVVGKEIFSAKIDSQRDVETSIDWRKKPQLNDHGVKMESVKLPDHVTSKLLLFMERIGLRFGCIDMIVTPEGEYVFLEINPNGQWYFVQLETGLEIATAIASLLC